MEGEAVGHNIEREPPKFVLIWFSGFRGEDINVIFYQIYNMSNLYKSVERKISQKKPRIYVNLLIVM